MVIKRSQAPQEVVEEHFEMPKTTQFSTQAHRQTIHEKIKVGIDADSLHSAHVRDHCAWDKMTRKTYCMTVLPKL